jgi:hypothetical protein
MVCQVEVTTNVQGRDIPGDEAFYDSGINEYIKGYY